MVIHNLMYSIAILLFISGLSVHQTAADTPPWELSKPKGMTATHQDNAIAARDVQKRLPKGGFGYDDPAEVGWDKRNSIYRTMPISNMTIASLTSLLVGKYHIRKAIGQDVWSVSYFGPDVTHFCNFTKGNYREKTLDRYITSTPFGLAGSFHRDSHRGPPSQKKNKGFPTIGDSDRGVLYFYYWTGRKWVPEPGWVQKEYAAAFAEHCPNLPRVAKVNNNQLGDTFYDLIKEATAIRGFQTAFKNNPEDPFTASMYYWLHPPQ